MNTTGQRLATRTPPHTALAGTSSMAQMAPHPTTDANRYIRRAPVDGQCAPLADERLTHTYARLSQLYADTDIDDALRTTHKRDGTAYDVYSLYSPMGNTRSTIDTMPRLPMETTPNRPTNAMLHPPMDTTHAER